MAVVEVVFSPTGGTKRVADVVAEELAAQMGCPVRLEDITSLEDGRKEVELAGDDVAVIAAPSFGGRVPQVAAERMARIQGNGARAVLVCVYGNRAYEDTLVEMQDVAEAAGCTVAAAVSAVAEHSIAHQFAAGRPDAADVDELRGFAVCIAEKLKGQGSAELQHLDLPGNRPYKKAGGAGLVPKPTKACVNCGVCARSCPVGAIDSADSHKVDSKACISCMRCIAVCPHKARANNKVMVAAVGAALKKACSDRKANELFC